MWSGYRSEVSSLYFRRIFTYFSQTAHHAYFTSLRLPYKCELRRRWRWSELKPQWDFKAAWLIYVYIKFSVRDVEINIYVRAQCVV